MSEYHTEVSSFVDRITERGALHVVTITRSLVDGVLVGEQRVRHVIAPGTDTVHEATRVQRIAAAEHTPEVVAAYQAHQAALLARLRGVAEV